MLISQCHPVYDQCHFCYGLEKDMLVVMQLSRAVLAFPPQVPPDELQMNSLLSSLCLQQQTASDSKLQWWFVKCSMAGGMPRRSRDI